MSLLAQETQPVRKLDRISKYAPNLTLSVREEAIGESSSRSKCPSKELE